MPVEQGEGGEDCLPCLEGFLCPVGSTNASGVGSCPSGEYTEDSVTCEKCSAGFYCPFEGTLTPIGNGTCDVLRHCDAGSTSSSGVGPCDDDAEVSPAPCPGCCPRPLFRPLDRDELKGAVDAWINNQTAPEGTYGGIQDWQTTKVTDMECV